MSDRAWVAELQITALPLPVNRFLILTLKPVEVASLSYLSTWRFMQSCKLIN